MKEWFKARNIWGASILKLTDEDAGKLAKAVWTYTMTGEVVELDGALMGCFAMMKMALEMDDEAATNLSRVRAEAGAKGGNQRVANQANVSSFNQNQPNQSNASIKNKNKNIDKEKEKEKEKDNTLFERFWLAYPKKVAKKDAIKAFEKLKPNDEMMAIIMRELERQKISPQWTKDGGQFIPYPATWLNGRRWEDSPVVPQAQGKKITAQDYDQRDYSEVQQHLIDQQNERFRKRLEEQRGTA